MKCVGMSAAIGTPVKSKKFSDLKESQGCRVIKTISNREMCLEGLIIRL